MPNLFANEDAIIVDPDKDWLSELVGENKKFSDTQALARSKAEADAHITRLEDEQKRLRDELKSRVKFEEFLDKLDSSEPPVTPPVNQEPVTPTALKTEDIERLLEQKINQRDQARIAEHNSNIVVNKLRETLGPNYAQHLKRQADDLGMSEQYVQTLAANNPKAFFKLFGIEENRTRESFTPPPVSSSTSFSLSPSRGKNDSYYENIRKTDPNLYWTPKVQNEIFDRIKEIGAEEFYK